MPRGPITTTTGRALYGCKCGCAMPLAVRDNIVALDYLLWKHLTDEGYEVWIISGFRCVRHNRRVRGARKSTHMRGMAADIVVRKNGRIVPPGRVFILLNRLQRNGTLPKGGLHAYPAQGFTHIDTRGRLARW